MNKGVTHRTSERKKNGTIPQPFQVCIWNLLNGYYIILELRFRSVHGMVSTYVLILWR